MTLRFRYPAEARIYRLPLDVGCSAVASYVLEEGNSMRKLTTVLQNLRVGVTSLVALLIVASSTHAQVGTATLSGTVTDPSAAVIPQAQVILSNTARHYVRQTTTGAGGNYVITSIDPGTYVLEVKAPAFKTERRTDVILTPAQSSTLDVQLE